MQEHDHYIALLCITLVAGTFGGYVSYYGLMNNRTGPEPPSNENGGGNGTDPAGSVPNPADDSTGAGTNAGGQTPAGGGGNGGGKNGNNVPADPIDTSVLAPVLRGIAAALLVPLFLQAVSSDLLTRVSSDIEGGAATGTLPIFGFWHYMTYGATCLVAAIFARTFIGNVSQRVIDAAKEAGARAGTRSGAQAGEETGKKAGESVAKEEVRKKEEETDEKIETIKTETGSDVRKALKGMMHGVAAATTATPVVQPNVTQMGMPKKHRPIGIHDPGDPNKKAFGELRTRNGWTLYGTVQPRQDSAVFFDVFLTVMFDPSAPDAAPATYDFVRFFLHPMFPPVTPVAIVNNTATLNLAAWGAFTVGAVVTTEIGDIDLELDLADPSIGAPPEFRER